MQNAAVMLCAGKSTRMRGRVDDKILVPLAGIPVVCHSVNAFIEAQVVDQFTFVYRDNQQRADIENALQHCPLNTISIDWTEGGGERQDSVFNALSDLSLLTDYVFIHDCARPLIRPEILIELNQAVAQDKAAVVAHRVTDTIKRAGDTTQKNRQQQLKDIPRPGLWAMETPQAFERELITESYRRIRYNNETVTDDTAAASRQGHKVTLIENLFPNPKITVPSDLAYIEFLLNKEK